MKVISFAASAIALSLMMPAMAGVIIDQNLVRQYPSCVLLTEPEIQALFGGPAKAAYMPERPDSTDFLSRCGLYSGAKGARSWLRVVINHWGSEERAQASLEQIRDDATLWAVADKIEGLGDIAYSIDTDAVYTLFFQKGVYGVTLKVAHKPFEDDIAFPVEKVMEAARYIVAKDLPVLAPIPFAIPTE